MGVEGHESQAVVDDDEVAVNTELTGEDHAAVIGCGDFGIADRGQVKTQMVGFAHLLALVGEVAVITKTGTGRGAGRVLAPGLRQRPSMAAAVSLRRARRVSTLAARTWLLI